MTAPPVRNAVRFLVCYGLAGCSFSLSSIDSRTDADTVPVFDQMVIVSAASDDGTNPEFPQLIDAAFHNAASRCAIKVSFIYERLDQKPIAPRYAATSGIELSIVPRIVFNDRSRSYEFNSRYGYLATLTDRSRNLELWKASFSIQPGGFWPNKGSARLATAIADPIFAQMAKDGVVHNCSSAD